MFLAGYVGDFGIRAWHMSDDESEHFQELEAPPVMILVSVYTINATLIYLLNQYLATTNHNVENIVCKKVILLILQSSFLHTRCK